MTSIEKLAHKFSRLPGVGAKTAMRYAYAVVSMSEAEAAEPGGGDNGRQEERAVLSDMRQFHRG